MEKTLPIYVVIIIVMKKIKQQSKGDNSPNIYGDKNHVSIINGNNNQVQQHSKTKKYAVGGIILGIITSVIGSFIYALLS